jgi:hypothetical protein
MPALASFIARGLDQNGVRRLYWRVGTLRTEPQATGVRRDFL